MPLPICLANAMSERLAQVRKDGTLPCLRPDGKTQVTVEYGDHGRPKRVAAVVVSAQHSPSVTCADLKNDIVEHVIGYVLDRCGIPWADAEVYVNPTGKFEIGGPQGDTGLSGRKLAVDTYGGYARGGGGNMSGKDPTKVDRSAAYAARWIAKNVVAARLAAKCEIQLSYAIGVAEPVSVRVDAFGTQNASLEKMESAIREVFDLRPGAIIRDLDLWRPIYSKTSAYGHFGRLLPEFSWERTDRADALAAICGVR